MYLCSLDIKLPFKRFDLSKWNNVSSDSSKLNSKYRTEKYIIRLINILTLRNFYYSVKFSIIAQLPITSSSVLLNKSHNSFTYRKSTCN